MSTELNMEAERPKFEAAWREHYKRERGPLVEVEGGKYASSALQDMFVGWCMARRASPAAAVPEGALPPLPDPFANTQVFKMAKLVIGHPDHYQGEFIRLSDARAAVEADRAQRQDMSMPPFAAPAGRHPIQPLGLDGVGTLRFKRNHIVDFLAKGRLNELACMDFPQEDREQLAQLIGYSLSGFGDLSYVTDETYEAAAAMWEQSEATRCRAEGGDGADRTTTNSVVVGADRAQQGEPVARHELIDLWNAAVDVAISKLGVARTIEDHLAEFVVLVGNRAATKAAAPADAPTDLPKRLRIKAGVMANGEKIAWGSDTELMLEAADYIERAAPVPDTGIPTDDDLLRFFNERDFYPENLERQQEFFDIVRELLTSKGRAPVSTTPTSGEVEKAAPRTYMTDEQAEKWAWEQVREQVGTAGWTAGDSCNYYGFFLWGWRYRKQYESQCAAPSHKSEAPTCTCPSGDGSLRWPCPVHPSEAKAGDDA